MEILILILMICYFYLIIRKLLETKEKPEVQSIAFENKFKVVEIIDGDTFIVSPGWKWNNEIGIFIFDISVIRCYTLYNRQQKGGPL